MLAVSLGLLVWWGCQAPFLALTRLSDGTEMALLGISYGGESVFDPAPPLLRRLEAAGLPLELQSPQRGFARTATLWLSWKADRDRAGFGPYARIDLQLTDAHGCRIQCDPIYPYSESTERVELPFQPLSDESWTLHFVHSEYPEQDVGRLAFPVRGKAVPSKPRNTPLPLPQTFSGERSRVTLERLTHRKGTNQPCSIVQFVADGKSGPGDNWVLWDVAAFDSRGRRGPETDSSLWGLEADWNFPFNGTCAREPYWKLVATSGPNPPTSLKPDFRWSDYEFTIREKKPWSQERATRRTDHGMKLEFLEQPLIRPFRPGIESYYANFDLDRKGQKYVVAVERINGMSVAKWCRQIGLTSVEETEFAMSTFTAGKQWSEFFLIPVTPKVDTLKLELVGYRTETLEFFVKP